MKTSTGASFASAASLCLAVLLLVDAAVANVRVRRIVGGRAAAPPPQDDPVVFVYKEDHDARVYGTRERPGGFYVYRGIRYAEPPVGLYRFQVTRAGLLGRVLQDETGTAHGSSWLLEIQHGHFVAAPAK